MRKMIVGFSLYYLAIGLTILSAPVYFYESTPGVSTMGPYNAHFITDVSFAFIASAAALLIGAYYSAKSTVISGALWPLMHALFHITIWWRRDFAVDLITVSDFLAVILPGLLLAFVVIRFKGGRND